MKILVSRYGAYGDSIIITPLLRHLKKEGHHIIMNTTDRGYHILKNNPNIDEWILQKTNPDPNFKKADYHPTKKIVWNRSVPADKLEDHWDMLLSKVKPDKFYNLTGSLEMSIALHPSMPQYNYPKQDRLKYSNINYYEETFRHLGFEIEVSNPDMVQIDRTIFPHRYMNPDIHLSAEEEARAKEILKKDKFNLIWGLSGSGNQKFYPHVLEIFDYLKKYEDVQIYTVGDEKCKMLEACWADYDNITCLSGKLTMMESIALLKYANLVVAPDTGLIHASGAFKIPKICLLGHTSKKNITKFFQYDYSLESNVECAPCSRIVYNAAAWCPTQELIDEEGHKLEISYCMYHGLHPLKIIDRIEDVLCRHWKKESKTLQMVQDSARSAVA